MDRSSVVVPVLIVVMGLFIEYMVFQPLGTSGLWILLIIGVIIFLTYEYHKNAYFPKLGLPSLKGTVSDIREDIEPVQKGVTSSISKSARESARFLANVSVIAVLLATLLSGFFIPEMSSLAVSLQEWAKSNNLPQNLPIIVAVCALFFTAIWLQGAQEGAKCDISRLIIILCLGLMILVYVPLPIGVQMQDGSSDTPLESASPIVLRVLPAQIVTTNELFLQQTISILGATILGVAWAVASILLSEMAREFTRIERRLDFITENPTISGLMKEQSDAIDATFRRRWYSFMDSPWADDYVSSIRGCVPLGCNGYLLTIGYVSLSESDLLNDVKGALEEDLQRFFDLPYLDIQYEQIDVDRHREIVRELDKLANSDEDMDSPRELPSAPG